MGRPGKYDTHVKPRLDEIRAWASSGSTNQEIAKALGVSMSAFCDYLSKYPEFSEAVSDSRQNSIAEVKNALYRKAVGFEYEEKKIYQKKDEDGNVSQYTEITKKQSLPDVNAIGMYLRNYDSKWSDSDAFTMKFKEMELELRKQLQEANNW